ncbi:hypothetical protein CDAR_542661 [Caerostris darwini]|uniref:Uncharacterized protein n=1 Tax=Caerostris darwini TaxID=1538125 RepID=A0AAV4VIF9_9ARAC|nr:hypothetical protein CDAR_542661 [Caerostris darwini]
MQETSDTLTQPTAIGGVSSILNAKTSTLTTRSTPGLTFYQIPPLHIRLYGIGIVVPFFTKNKAQGKDIGKLFFLKS